jgi:hypothetical protein
MKGLIIKGSSVPRVVAIVSIKKEHFSFLINKNNPNTKNMRIDSGTLHTLVIPIIRESRIGD